MPDIRKEEVVLLINKIAAAWNREDLEAVCELYVSDATYLTESGMTTGREQILERYRTAYTAKAMGTLSLRILEFRSGRIMASAILEWRLVTADGKTRSGMSMIVVEPRGEDLFVVQDASL